MLRVCERWRIDEEDYWRMGLEEQVRLLAYEALRVREEAGWHVAQTGMSVPPPQLTTEN